MSAEPQQKRAIAFFDGQNLFYAAKYAFLSKFPDYDPLKLARAVCAMHGWSLEGTHFYTGVPSASESPLWHTFWTNKLEGLRRQGVQTYSRPLKYRSVTMPDGSQRQVGQEKGIDLRLALDVVRLVQEGQCDIAILFSQDQDLSEVSREVRLIAQKQRRWIKIVSAFPFSPTYTNQRGINDSDWIKISQSIYQSCLDPTEYRGRFQ